MTAPAPRNSQSLMKRKSSRAIIGVKPIDAAEFHHSHHTAAAVETNAASVSQPAMRRSRPVWWRHATTPSSTSDHAESTSSGSSALNRSRVNDRSSVIAPRSPPTPQESLRASPAR